MATIVDSPMKPARRDPTPSVAPWTLKAPQKKKKKGVGHEAAAAFKS